MIHSSQLYEFNCFSVLHPPPECAVVNNFLIFCRFTSAVAGLPVNDIIQRTAGRLESLHSEGVHV